MACFLQDSFLVGLMKLPENLLMCPFLGMGASGFIKERLGYYGNFTLGIVLIVICILYTVIFLKVS